MSAYFRSRNGNRSPRPSVLLPTKAWQKQQENLGRTGEIKEIICKAWNLRMFQFARSELLIVKLISTTHIHQTEYWEMNPTANSFALSEHVTLCLKKQ